MIHLDDFPMNFDIPELGKVGIEELFRPKLIGQTPHMSIFIRDNNFWFKYPIPWVLLSPESDDYLREVQEQEVIRLGDPLLEDSDLELDDEAYHNFDT
ncbi:hypothetical protein Ddye_009440 [Dipteronia dyeriana]|uniref:Uncharacterized protein n=1 Tax=Dipteronia dyeriana TaxID=168575 RepID=A0AAD9XBL8_9ROSI|nr:hypothetical protein Ddye_009440 [Dipteronia dyeriana]